VRRRLRKERKKGGGGAGIEAGGDFSQSPEKEGPPIKGIDIRETEGLSNPKKKEERLLILGRQSGRRLGSSSTKGGAIIFN